ncbi:RsmB/NOP family class I SAM-dependent RNA methyltransferase [Leeia sp. TBRC 13508]|uniref:RsmB/NOP family class I SAM-dependent RNA methyltransferase n=1 Tax=Leeia speluncae TaxID=2884804 RepID=A0ABS8D9E2_9NEIS|nr:RsmB/NOP family class I SAM-dependent RNA methyltransferase [Leeia speluncae]MCB6184837.1 RsmB/NOP family class I SAM-dependent RNA methyltransferase [Leeia speluncae]
MSIHSLPTAFAEKIAEIIPSDRLGNVLESFTLEKNIAFRINTIKADVQAVKTSLLNKGFDITEVDWYKAALIIPAHQKRALTETNEFHAGEIYIQNLSSQLAPIALAPEAEETVLDLAAAPGGKTTLIAALMNNTGRLSAVEPVRDRFFRLKANLDQQGVTIAKTYMTDGRSVGKKCPEMFDRILLDAPCSSEARFDLNEADSMSHWSPAKVKETSHKQRRLLLSAFYALKKDGILLYCTCAFSPEENEVSVAHLIKDFAEEVEVLPIQLPESFPKEVIQNGLTSWKGKALPAALQHAIRILPNEQFDGFFMCMLKKKA